MLRLDEEGSFGLDDRVADLIAAFGQNGKEDVTLRHLLTHTSGLPVFPAEPRRAEERAGTAVGLPGPPVPGRSLVPAGPRRAPH